MECDGFGEGFDLKFAEDMRERRMFAASDAL
jgi:hypothetical protein